MKKSRTLTIPSARIWKTGIYSWLVGISAVIAFREPFGSFDKTKHFLPHGPAIMFLGIYSLISTQKPAHRYLHVIANLEIAGYSSVGECVNCDICLTID